MSERRKQSEKWVGEKAKEWANADSDLTFADWCYRQGGAEERKKCGEELLKVINEKPYGMEKNNWWLISQIRHFCFGVQRICDKKEQK